MQSTLRAHSAAQQSVPLVLSLRLCFTHLCHFSFFLCPSLCLSTSFSCPVICRMHEFLFPCLHSIRLLVLVLLLLLPCCSVDGSSFSPPFPDGSRCFVPIFVGNGISLVPLIISARCVVNTVVVGAVFAPLYKPCMCCTCIHKILIWFFLPLVHFYRNFHQQIFRIFYV